MKMRTKVVMLGQAQCFLSRIQVPTFSLVVLFLVGQLLPVQSCPLEIWTFASLPDCTAVSANVNTLQPLSKGSIFADGTCRTTDVLSSSLNPPGVQLPGTYSAYCVASSTESPTFGIVQMWESGCIDSECGQNLDTNPPGTCDRDMTSLASIYSRLSPPGELVVQDPTLRSTGYFRCFQFGGGGATTNQNVTFAVFGNCNCQSTDAPVEPPRTNAPTFAPTSQPTALPSTSEPTLAPVVAATTTTEAATTAAATTEATTEYSEPVTTAVSATAVQDPPVSDAPPETIPSETEEPTDKQTEPPVRPTEPSPVKDDNDETKDSPLIPESAEAGSTSILPMVAGGAVAGAVCVALAVSMVWFLTKRKRKSAQLEKEPKSPEDGTPIPASLSTKSPPQPFTQPPGRLFSEIVCSPSDDISTLGEPLGMEWQNQFRSDESTASVPMSYIRNMMAQEGGFLYATEGDTASRTETSAMSTVVTEIDPDKFMPADDDDEESFEHVFHRAFTPSKKENVLRFQINVPPGRLGMLLDAAEGIPTVNQIKPDSVFASQNVRVGDHLIAVDDIDVRGMEPIDVSQLIVMKARQPRRVFVFERRKRAGHEVDIDGDEQV